MTQHVWKYPGDTLMDLVKRLMLTYRQALQDRDPEACEQIDKLALEEPKLWPFIPSMQPLNTDDLLPAADIAQLVGVDENTPRVWAARGDITKYTAEDGAPRYLVSEVVELMKKRRQRRAQAG